MEHYFTNDENLQSKEKTIKLSINDKPYSFITDNGVFSKKSLDFGTKTLLENIPLDKIKGNVLDLGCGYGPIGIFIKSNTESIIDMIDINDRSMKLAKKNAILNKVNVNVFKSDGYESITKKYDFIITNPPIRVGKEILYNILLNAKNYLVKNGELWLVINKNQGAKSLVKYLQNDYSVKIICQRKGFVVICAICN